MTTQSVTPQRQKYRDILNAASALANGKDPADFPKYGFDPTAESVAEIFRKIGLTALREPPELTAVTLRLDDPVCWPALALYAKALESHDPDEAAKIQAGLAEAGSVT